jgi:alkylhydroperoxidase family enzyme
VSFAALPLAGAAANVQALRDAGFADRAIHDATQVVAYFHYINRIAEGLGVPLEDFVSPWGAHPPPKGPGQP